MSSISKNKLETIDLLMLRDDVFVGEKSNS